MTNKVCFNKKRHLKVTFVSTLFKKVLFVKRQTKRSNLNFLIQSRHSWKEPMSFASIGILPIYVIKFQSPFRMFWSCFENFVDGKKFRCRFYSLIFYSWATKSAFLCGCYVLQIRHDRCLDMLTFLKLLIMSPVKHKYVW